jgi:biotin carboxyl carrier protein
MKPDIVEVEKGVYSVLRDGVSYEARVDGNTVTIAGRGYNVEREDPRQYRRGGSSAIGQGRDSVKAPMPGKIVRILVKTGDEVSAGQGIAVVEAMKMQNELRAPHAGHVKSIQVRENDTVEAGFVVAVIE